MAIHPNAQRRARSMTSTQKYWFPAKRYGWGWGVPSCWQGWAVLVVYFVLLGAGVWAYPPHRMPFMFLLSTVGLSLVLVAVCWLKGEPPRWRWGDDDR
jgi:hypothetical protein